MTNELIVFPTELALRRFQQKEALQHGWIDASRHTTFPRLRKLCLVCAPLKGEQMNTAQQLLIRRQVVEVAAGHFHGQGALGELSHHALGDVLDQFIAELASLPGEAARVVDWLLSHHRNHKLYQIGMLFSVWRATIKQEGVVDAIDINTALLKLLQGSRSDWPPQLRDCRQLIFSAVRWLNPFEEQCVSALNKKLKIRIESALPPAHAEEAADRMGQRIQSEIMDSSWAVWAEDLGDALAVNNADILQLSDTERISFSRSAGAYGEIEDLARRIGWNLQALHIPAHRIALIVPNVGTVQDIIPHVFGRFRIPYFFRRGRPVLSSPCVKTFLAWLAFPLRPERDIRIDLLRNPTIRFDAREQEIERLQKQSPLLEVPATAISGFQALEILTERIVEPEDHFNAAALRVMSAALEQIGNQTLPLRELVDLLEELLENETVRPRESHEQGVWILNPYDAVGLDFDIVLFAGLNEGSFPGVPQQDALLNDHERHFLKLHLEEQGRTLPKMALPKADVLFEQESVLFLTAVGMAREQLVFSYQSVDQEGNEKTEGEYYRKLWNLAGWCSLEKIQLSPYDQWRIQTLETDSVFSNHWRSQQTTAPEDRVPMPGESFLPIIPLQLCRAQDEALQSAVQIRQVIESDERRISGDTEAVSPMSIRLEHVVKMLQIEAERDAFLDTPAGERTSSVYCGHIPALREKVEMWFEANQEMSPTALEALAQCRYIFLIERIFGVRDRRMADDTPDPMERGGLIHSILHEIYAAIAIGHSGIQVPRYWAVQSSTGWKLRTEEGMGAIPLAVFVPEFGNEYEEFARKIANRRMDSAVLGHPGVWAAERRKILEMVLNFIRYDAQTCAAEKRYPALFELKFGGETAIDLGLVKLHGVIDRVDLVFADTGDLKKVRVLDYKGASRSRSNTGEYVEEIVSNLDCQLPVYAFAAQQFFFEAFNDETVNAKTETGYLFYERDFSKIGKALSKSLVSMDEPNLTTGFVETLFANLQKLKNGDFAVDPLIETYTDYMSVCRAPAISIEDLQTLGYMC